MSETVWVATRKGVFCLRRRKAWQWEIVQAALLGSPSTIVLAHAGQVYAAQEHGHYGVKLMRSGNGGADWEEIGTPRYPEKPVALSDNDPIRDDAVPWDLKRIWALEPAHPERPDALWCGTLPGGLFRSNDAGATWELVRSLWDRPERRAWFGGGADYPGIHSILVDPRDPRVVRIGISCGGLWITQDNGVNWHCGGPGMRAAYMPPEQALDPNIQDPHRVVQCRAAPDHLWTQHHNGIFKSGDGGRSWTEIANAEPSNFGFAVVVHPQDPNTAWFAPAARDDARYPADGAVVVSRTCDGGQSFEVLRRGLPQRHAYDLVYRHGLDISAHGEWLVMGSTTGALWVSEDQGERWAEVNAHLPPIYCVRFGA